MQKAIIDISRRFIKLIIAIFWEVFKSSLWLLIQVIELAAWIVSALSEKIARMQRMVKIALNRNKTALITWPLKQLLLGIWAVIVAIFWLLIQTIELFIWVLSQLGEFFSSNTFPSISDLKSGVKKTNHQLWLRKKLKRRKYLLLIAIILLLPSVLLALASFTAAEINFQGHLLVKGMSFTYVGSYNNKLFLNSIRRLKQIEIEGRQQLTLIGKFQSQTTPTFNSLTKLTVQLPSRSSKLILKPVDSQHSQLELFELRLQPNTKVTDFSYNPDGHKLTISLLPESAKLPNFLKLSLGKQPLNITLENYNLPDSNLKHTQTNFTEFTFTPTQAEVNIVLEKSTGISINLPAAEPDISNQWIWGYLNVQDVKFYQTTPSKSEPSFYSTIIQGKVQMAGQELNITSDRFFLPSQPGIQRLGDIRIHSQKPQSLEVRIQGKASSIAVGTDINSPINRIQGKFLNRYLSRYGLPTLLAFWAATVGSLLLWFFKPKS
ncbi:MAG: hypothetical protein N3E45_06985 [Oscillatoriaceae bacterium SKW80]|nr:hypothetical protein [Oscillatoriaceae bacterium SKW80]HIK27132.1 hypothetical protein [Oscillatoriaceae cyanobacterium M7585_C2015_266]